MGARCSAGSFSVDVHVAICLRMLANAQYLDIMLCFGILQAIDGIDVEIKKPTEFSDPAQYFSRKRYCCLPIQAIVDSGYQFLYPCANCVGSTHDSLAFGVTRFASDLENGFLPMPYHLVGDDAYGSSDYVLVPVPAVRAPPGSTADAYNFFSRQCEFSWSKLFGQLLER
eukprot:IDg11175t1